MSASALGLYHKIVSPTYNTDNKNTITQPGSVSIDQRVIADNEDTFIGIKLWFIKIGVSVDIPTSKGDK